MNFVWAKGFENAVNYRLIFSLAINSDCDQLEICAVDAYQVFVDDKFISYGPEFTAAGYSRRKLIKLSSAKKVEVKVISYGVDNYVCDRQAPFFGATLYKNGKAVYETLDFSCYEESSRTNKTPRYSRQRGFVEKYDLGITKNKQLDVSKVPAPVILDGCGEFCSYNVTSFLRLDERKFKGFYEVRTPWWSSEFNLKDLDWDLETGFFQKIDGYYQQNFALDGIKAGFLSAKIVADEDTEIFFVFEEILPDGKWIYARSHCNDVITLKIPKGESSFISCEPYTMHHLMILSDKKIQVTPSIIEYKNDTVKSIPLTNNEKIDTVLDAARNSFMHNAVTIFTDCPGRERAGWLCDSYFSGLTEYFFTNKNAIERNFIENIIISHTEEIDDRLFPRCFPSQTQQNDYDIAWGMWFVLEIGSYYSRTGDLDMLKLAKNRVYNFIDYCSKYVNEFGLLEDLNGMFLLGYGGPAGSWEYKKGVNFPVNMQYMATLDCVSRLYDDKLLQEQAQKMRNSIMQLSYNGTFFIDNAERVDGKLVCIKDHVSEICQNYAMFFGLSPDKAFEKRLIDNFGPLRDDKTYSNIDKIDMFNGHIIRFFWLYEKGEYERLINESVEYLYPQSKLTRTFWEYSNSQASCDHGYASSVAVLILNSLEKLK